MLHRNSRNVSDHHEGVLRFCPWLFSWRSVSVLASGMSAWCLRDDTILTSGMAGPVLQTLHHHLPSRRVITLKLKKTIIYVHVHKISPQEQKFLTNSNKVFTNRRHKSSCWGVCLYFTLDSASLWQLIKNDDLNDKQYFSCGAI